jgi:N-acetylmuramoyl-L-alanine amidase
VNAGVNSKRFTTEETIMLASKIPGAEESTHNYHLGRGELTAGMEGAVPLFDFKPIGRDGYFYPTTTAKKAVVLHYTMGYLGGDLATLTQDKKEVSVSFVVARNGRIYRLFPTENWSYHLGSGTIGGNLPCSKRSIGIELSSMGPLDQSGSWMWTYVGTKYCKVSETSFYQTLPAPYRGKTHYATFPAEQISAADRLVRELCAKHAIPRSFIPTAKRYNPFGSPAEGSGYNGVCSHVNYRATGKSDIGPAFPWSAVGG